MKITKQIAAEVANKVTANLRAEYEKICNEIDSRLVTIVKNGVPEEVAQVYRKYPAYILTNSSAAVSGVGVPRRWVYLDDEIPYTDEITLSREQSKEIADMVRKADKLNDRIRDTRAKVRATLLALGTAKKVQEQLPELVQFLPEQAVTSTALMIPVKEVRSDLKKLGIVVTETGKEKDPPQPNVATGTP